MIEPLPGEHWYVLARFNRARDEVIDGVRHTCPDSLTPINISTNREYLEAFLKNGGQFQIIEVMQKP